MSKNGTRATLPRISFCSGTPYFLFIFCHASVLSTIALYLLENRLAHLILFPFLSTYILIFICIYVCVFDHVLVWCVISYTLPANAPPPAVCSQSVIVILIIVDIIAAIIMFIHRSSTFAYFKLQDLKQTSSLKDALTAEDIIETHEGYEQRKMVIATLNRFIKMWLHSHCQTKVLCILFFFITVILHLKHHL